MKLTNMRVGKRKVSSRKRKKMEHRRTEGDPRNTQAPFRLQDFKMWKCTVLLLLALLPTMNSNETPTPRMCAVCLEKDCATGVRRIYPAGSDRAVWSKANSRTGIQNFSMENLKPDVPCKMANGSLILQANEMLHFEGIDTHVFNSQISPCADLNLPLKPSLGVPHLAPMTKAPIHNTPTPAALNDSVADNKCIIIGIIIGIIGIIIGSVIGIGIGFLIWKRNSCGQGQGRDHRHGNNRVPPHDAVHRDENATKINLLNAEVPNGNVNGVHREDDSVGTAGLLGHCDHTPV